MHSCNVHSIGGALALLPHSRVQAPCQTGRYKPSRNSQLFAVRAVNAGGLHHVEHLHALVHEKDKHHDPFFDDRCCHCCCLARRRARPQTCTFAPVSAVRRGWQRPHSLLSAQVLNLCAATPQLLACLGVLGRCGARTHALSRGRWLDGVCMHTCPGA